MTPEELQTYAAKFIANRFPEGLPDKMVEILAEMVLDAFAEGTEWADREAMRSDIIIAPHQIITTV